MQHSPARSWQPPSRLRDACATRVYAAQTHSSPALPFKEGALRMELFTVIMLVVDAVLVVAIAIRAKAGEKPPRDYVAPSQRAAASKQ